MWIVEKGSNSFSNQISKQRVHMKCGSALSSTVWTVKSDLQIFYFLSILFLLLFSK